MGNALAQPVPGCNRSADEATRLETARAILKVNAIDFYYVINYWAEDAVYKETVLTNHSRQEMWEYLSVVFYLSPDMELVIEDEVYETHADGSMTYMATNKWFGNWEGVGPYVQPGMSIVKFRPGEGCASFQRDYFTEGDTWWGVPQLQPMIRELRQGYIYMFQLSNRCFDEDGDGFSKYQTFGCAYQGLDCNDYSANIHPEADEILGNGIDDNCDGFIDVPDTDDDGDSIPNDLDICPSIYDPDQADFDGDGEGDACDDDVDDDGVENDIDACAATMMDEIVDPELGCSITQLCPCEGPRATTVSWKNHKKYVSCVYKTAKEFVSLGLITQADKHLIKDDASQSDCGY